MFRKQKRLGNSKRRGRLRWMHGYPAPAKTTGAGGSGPERCRQILQQDPPLQHTGCGFIGCRVYPGRGDGMLFAGPFSSSPLPNTLYRSFSWPDMPCAYTPEPSYIPHMPQRESPRSSDGNGRSKLVFSCHRGKGGSARHPAHTYPDAGSCMVFPPDQAPSASFMRLTASGGASLAAISRNSASFRRCLTCGSLIGVVWPGSVSRS